MLWAPLKTKFLRPDLTGSFRQEEKSHQTCGSLNNLLPGGNSSSLGSSQCCPRLHWWILSSCTLTGAATAVRWVKCRQKAWCSERSSVELQSSGSGCPEMSWIQPVCPVCQTSTGNMIWQQFSSWKCPVLASLVMSLDLTGSGIQDSLLSLLLSPSTGGFAVLREKKLLSTPGHPQTPLSPFQAAFPRHVLQRAPVPRSTALPGTFMWSCVAWPRPGSACLNVLCLLFSSKLCFFPFSVCRNIMGWILSGETSSNGW